VNIEESREKKSATDETQRVERKGMRGSPDERPQHRERNHQREEARRDRLRGREVVNEGHGKETEDKSKGEG